VERLNLNADEITIQAVHPSIIGQDTWFQITYTSSGTTRYLSHPSKTFARLVLEFSFRNSLFVSQH
jgi:hypothetical protein